MNEIRGTPALIGSVCMRGCTDADGYVLDDARPGAARVCGGVVFGSHTIAVMASSTFSSCSHGDRGCAASIP